jgi:hypothetical protein
MTIDVCSIDVMLHWEITHAHLLRVALRHKRMRFDDGKRVSDCFLPPPHRELDLNGNKLMALPDGIFSGLTSLR